jgi:hypothetical protein
MTVIDHSVFNKTLGGRRVRDYLIVGFTTTCVNSDYHH